MVIGKKKYQGMRNIIYILPDIVSVIKSRRIRWWEHVACMEKLGMLTFFVGKPKRKR